MAKELYKEMQKRGWDVKESAVMAITANELDLPPPYNGFYGRTEGGRIPGKIILSGTYQI
ncbi:hypothetical protein ACNKHR_24795 [Shigella flexneri]